MIEIGGVEIARGQRLQFDLPAVQLYTHTDLAIPVEVVNGKRDGPRLLVCAAVHGDELNGVEIIRRLLQYKGLSRLHGTLIAVPIVNVFGFIHRSRYLPDRRDLNRCFPGSAAGSLASRVARVFVDGVLSKATHILDLHTAAIHRDNLPQIRGFLGDEATSALAMHFGLPMILNSNLIEGSLRHTAHGLGIPALTYEAGEALRFNETAIRIGVRGVINVMRHLRMLPGRSEPRKQKRHHIARSSSWVRTSQDGVFRPLLELGELVKKGQLLARVSSPFGGDEVEITAPARGILIGRNNLPLVNQGDAVFHLARFDEAGEVAQEVADNQDDALSANELD